ncbi:hypothetical protein [Erythrobacter sp. R86502]|uniref:hypothetical protein n=1 Tax=Erythrobacter sp. R86502 TaxID=3093846 RepID=UPI0036D22DBD
MTMLATIRVRAFAAVTICALMLTGCFMTPGKFTSDLAITGADTFTFRYEGEIFFLGLSQLAQMDAATESFTAYCFDEETYESRDCTTQEIADQRESWEAVVEGRAAEAKRKASQIASVMGGIDPSDPEAADELVALLQRQKGWERVVHKGDGLFDVSYQVTGTMGHDFLFPMIEGFPSTNPFVEIYLRKGNQVRINAPGFATQNADAAGMGAMMGMGSLAGLAALGSVDSAVETGNAGEKGIPVVEGTFTIRVAEGIRILANNTDEGPTMDSGGEVLTWQVSPRSTQIPTALIAATR